MIYNYTVKLYNRSAPTKVDGISIPATPIYVKEIECDIQPYSTELLLRQYGYNIEVNKRIFMEADSDVKIGSVFYCVNPQGNTEKYEVKKIINWDYLELACLGVT